MNKASSVITSGKVPVKIWTDDIEESAKKQLTNISEMPFIHKHVAVMPDVHAGIGATIGSVIPTVGAIIPAAVGVDIGCGMLACMTSLTANDLDEKTLKQIYNQICRDVPVGHQHHTNVSATTSTMYDTMFKDELDKILEKHPLIGHGSKTAMNWKKQLGSLGGGNHFIELCLDQDDRVWIMLHSGSRGIGNAFGKYFIELAREDMRKYFINLPDIDLAYIPEGTNYFTDYTDAVYWAQKYADVNRRQMLELIVAAMVRNLPNFKVVDEVISCHHNYIAHENHFGKNVYVTRKGAIRAREGDIGIIPGSMGAKSFIVRGKGNPESFCSCSHGAGRKMSRTQAEKQFTKDDLIQQTDGVMCRKDKGVIDEIPAAYKDIDVVMNNQSDLVDIVHTLKQIMCIKG